MIRIQKPSTPPAILTNDGAKATIDDCNAYARDRRSYKNGSKTFEFKRTIYGHETVKQTLAGAQHGKCAFCESPITHVQSGDVEHFRPKAGIGRGKKLVRPGYYWLAYDWDNLLFACGLCNRRHKRNAFPLLGGSRRARSHLDSVTAEQPLFIHPAKEDPERLIGFRAHIPYARKGNPRARRTIKELGLDRPDLMDVRAGHLEWVKTVRNLVRICPPGPDRDSAEQLLAEAQQPPAPFSAMVRCFLAAI
jgi:uncharacterized protein (TIGR02646 family)